MAKSTLQKCAVTQHIANAYSLKGQLPEGSMESLATAIHFFKTKCQTLSSELRQVALPELLGYLSMRLLRCKKHASETGPPAVWSDGDYTISCGDSDEKKAVLRDSCEERLKESGGGIWLNVVPNCVCTTA
ncbi:hypothetical protein RB195_011470 [Necator americanus]|uniref:Uncharacterized protein n=1 Tax=Necator americanus TaxID=51031 RepID=A0ABR1D2P7_NECAM